MDKRRFQLLINADNLSPAYLDGMLAEAAKCGKISVKRIYGDWVGSNKRPWKELLTRNSVVPVQTCDAESTMMLDALDIMNVKEVDGVILAAFDSDFEKVAGKLKAAGKVIIGMGDGVTPSAYRTACETFIFFDVVTGNGVANKAKNETATDVLQRKETDGNVAHDGSCAGGSEIVCAETGKGNVSAQGAMAEKQDTAGAEATVGTEAPEAVEMALTVGLKDVENFTLEILAKEENGGKVLMETLALMLKQKYPLFSHKKFGYSKFPQFIESISGLQVVSAPPKYELGQPKMYVVSREYAENAVIRTERGDAEEIQVLEEVLPAISLQKIEAAILEIIENEESNAGSEGASLGLVRHLLKKKYPEFDQRMYGRAKFNKFMELIPSVQMQLEEVAEEGQIPRMFVVKK